MKLVEQYLSVVSGRLPWRGRKDVLDELRSALLDDIEAKFGAAPTEAEIKRALAEYGSPTEVAARYSNNSPVIPEGLKELYFLLLKITVGALAIAFVTVAAIESLQGGLTAPTFGKVAVNFLSRLINGSLAATGSITLGFIAFGRLRSGQDAKLAEAWNPNELDAVVLDEGKPSLVESAFAIVGSAAFITILVFFPRLLTYAENGFFSTGLGAGISHRINLGELRLFALALSPLLVAQIVCETLNARAILQARAAGDSAKDGAPAAIGADRGFAKRRVVMQVIDAIGFMIIAAMVFDQRLYAEYQGILGFRAVFSIVALVQAIELATTAGKSIIRKIQEA